MGAAYVPSRLAGAVVYTVRPVLGVRTMRGGDVSRYEGGEIVPGRPDDGVMIQLSPARHATAEDVARGVTLDDLSWGARCHECNGEGWTNPLPNLPREECPGCGGWGRIAYE